MQLYQYEFIKFSLANQVLKFGEFFLKSGRKSPYFFNAGLFNNGEAFYDVGKFYANTINDNFLDKYNLILGPAYKGISLAVAASIGLKTQFNKKVDTSFTRKEIKNHGEGGTIIGASLEGKNVLIIDDVITSGETIKETVELINKNGGKAVGIMVAFDRQEKGRVGCSAIEEIQQEFKIKVSSIICLDNLIEYLSISNYSMYPNHQAYLKAILDYHKVYKSSKAIEF